MRTLSADGGGSEEFGAMSLAELAAALRVMGEDEAAVHYRWLRCLAEFDRRQGWAVDGALSCADWLSAKRGVARATAFEKLRVAHELERRPVLCEAAAAGRLTWCQLRVVTRITAASEGMDRAFVNAARSASVADLEGLVRRWKDLQDQEAPPRDERALGARSIRIRPYDEELDMVQMLLPKPDAHELLCDLDAESFRARVAARAITEQHESHPVDESPRGDSVDKSGKVDNSVETLWGRPAEAIDEQTEATEGATDEEAGEWVDPPDGATWQQRRADALIELVRAGQAAIERDAETGAVLAASTSPSERRIVHVNVDYDRLVGVGSGRAELFGGLTISGHTLRRMACDAGIVRHVTRGRSEVLDVGRRTQTWTVAQRRALIALFGGRCAFPGCWRNLLELHHIEHWGQGGPTDLDNGAPLCWSHHHLVHEGGWSALGNPLDGTLAFVAPDPDNRLHPAQYPMRLEPAA